MKKEQERTREAIALLEKSTTNPTTFKALTDSFDTFNELLTELDSDVPFSELKLKN